MKTTLELSDELFRRIKSTAASRGVSIRQLVTEAMTEKIARRPDGRRAGWRSVFGKVPRKDVRTVDSVIQSEFERTNPADWT